MAACITDVSDIVTLSIFKEKWLPTNPVSTVQSLKPKILFSSDEVRIGVNLIRGGQTKKSERHRNLRNIGANITI
jgi:hypothetical protein